MKFKIDRRLSEGQYVVTFKARDFTDDERERFRVFGTPEFYIPVDLPDGTRNYQNISLTRLHYYTTSFSTREEAEQFEQQLLAEIRTKVEELRNRQDDFTSSEEADI